MCCGVSNFDVLQRERWRSLRVTRMEEVRATRCRHDADLVPQECVSHFECLKFEGDEAYADIEILDVVSFLARQVNEQKYLGRDFQRS